MCNEPSRMPAQVQQFEWKLFLFVQCWLRIEQRQQNVFRCDIPFPTWDVLHILRTVEKFHDHLVKRRFFP